MKSLEIIKNRAKKYDFFNSPSKFMFDLSEEEWNDLIRDLEVLDLIYTKHIDISDLKIAMALEKDRNYKEEDGLRFYNIAPFNVKRITIDEYKKLKQWVEEQ